jgi:hypothetical protein
VIAWPFGDGVTLCGGTGLNCVQEHITLRQVVHEARLMTLAGRAGDMERIATAVLRVWAERKRVAT